MTSSSKADKVNYKEVTVPAGTFRMYDDRPYVWVEVPQDDGYRDWCERGCAMAAESKK